MSRIPQFPFRSILGSIALGLLIGLVGCGSPPPTDPLIKAQQAIEAGNLEQAESFAKEVPKESDQWSDAQMLLARVAGMSGRPQDGMSYLESIPRDGSAASLRAARAIADVQSQHGTLERAADAWEYILEHRRQDLRVTAQLGQLLTACGLRDRAQSCLFEVIKSGRLEVEDVVALSVPDRRANNAAALQRRLARVPDDAFTRLGLAFQEFADQKFDSARQHVRQVIQSRPEIVEAQSLWGELCLDGDLSELESWQRQLPEAAQNHAGVWFVRGQWARMLKRDDVAARCFWECVRHDPTNRRAMYQLGQALLAQDSVAATEFLHRAAQLKELAELVEQTLIQQGRDRAAFRKLVESLQQMGRDWEAWAWVTMASGMIGLEEPILRSLEHLQRPPAGSPRFRRDQDLAVRHDLSDLPNFDAVQKAADRTPLGSDAAAIRFQDDSDKLGIAFTFFQSRDPDPQVVRIFESTGGGVGVLDFDRDGWPDYYFTQGQEWPRGADRPAPTGKHRDRLFRNQAASFCDVTDAANFPPDLDYGQGCSCGDFNNDGFPDLYVANIGRNRLFQNQGDGTFLDVTEAASIDDAAWTTSCVILDLNADGDPDLYDVNYLQGENVYRVECAASRCSVKHYEGAPDRVWLSQGDGRFVAVPDATPRQGGKGLGVVALFQEGDRRPCLFVGNDQVPNFFLRPAKTDGVYADEAFARGLALNRNGDTTASMGIAAGDINHDGQVDLLVTNFEGEANSLFLQRDQGLFEDAIVGSGLMAAGIPYVGWGAQFLDADNDGELDLVVANGHVAEFHEPGIEYRMPTQFFHNTGRAFQQLRPADVGPYFQHKRLGRSIATCDWNRDGRMDVVVSNIESPAAVLTNVTPPSGHWLDVFLFAKNSARDAIGTVVEVKTDRRRWIKQLGAGDGYLASNERMLRFGIGAAKTIDEVIVRWPSGTEQRFSDVPASGEVWLVEGRSLEFKSAD